MAAITYLEYAKSFDIASKQRAIIELFPESVDFLSVLPFQTAPGGVYRYQEEAALSNGMAFRALNEEPSTAFGLVQDRVEQCYPIAGQIDVDRVQVQRMGSDHRSTLERMEIKKKASVWADNFMFGDNATNPRTPTGLKTRLRAVGGSTDGSNYMSRILANSASAGGAALSLAQLDRAIGLVENPNAIIMSKALKDRFAAAERDTAIGGFVSQDKDNMGRVVTRYNGLPIYTGYGITKLGAFLPFNEVAAGGGSAVTGSVYIVRFAEDGVTGLQTAPMAVTDIGLTPGGTFLRTDILHDVGMAILDPFAAIRLSSITNAAIVK